MPGIVACHGFTSLIQNVVGRSSMDERKQDPGFSSWRRRLFLIFSVALLIRFVFILTLDDGFYFADAPVYSAAASHLVEHGEFPKAYGRAPLYPLFVAGVYRLAGEGVIFLRILQAVLGACVAVLIAVIGKRAGGPGVGTIAGMLWSVYPMGIFIAGLVYPTTLVTFLLACGVLCLLSNPGHHRYTARVALAGLFFGLVVLAKPIVLGTVVLIAFWILFWRRSGGVFLASIFLFTTLASLVPWTVRNAYVYDRLIPIEARLLNKDRVTVWAKRPADPDESENIIFRYIGRIANRFPGEFASFFELYPRRVNLLKQSIRDRVHERNPRFVRYTIFGSEPVIVVSVVSVGSIFAFALIGVWAMWREKDKRREFSLLVLMIMSFALSYAATWGKIRYRIPVDPYIIILSSFGVICILSRLVMLKSLVQRKCAPG